MGKEIDVLDVIVSLVLSLCLLLRLAWVYALEDAQPPTECILVCIRFLSSSADNIPVQRAKISSKTAPELGKTEQQLLQPLIPGDILYRVSCLSLHIR